MIGRTSSDFSCGGKAPGTDFRMKIQDYILLLDQLVPVDTGKCPIHSPMFYHSLIASRFFRIWSIKPSSKPGQSCGGPSGTRHSPRFLDVFFVGHGESPATAPRL